MEEEFAELREEILKIAKRPLMKIEDVGGKIVFTFKTGGRKMDAQDERIMKLLAFRIESKEATFKYV